MADTKNPILAKKRKRIIKALTANPDAMKVARKIGGVNTRTICRIAKAEGIRLAPCKSPGGERSPRLAPDRRTAIIQALRANPNVAQVTEEIGGVGYNTVHRIARTEGIQLTIGKPIGRERNLLLSPDHSAAITEALKASPNVVQEIAKKMSVSPTAVYRFAKAAGIKLKRRSRVRRKMEKNKP